MTPEDEEFARIDAEIKRRQGDALPAPNCTRSHPHENMDAMCELRTEIARLTNENARIKAAQPAVPLTPAQKIALAEDWFTEDWAITKAVGMMTEYEMRLAHGIAAAPEKGGAA